MLVWIVVIVERKSMSQCMSKGSPKGKSAQVKDIPPNNLLGRMLATWECEEHAKGLDNIKMVEYCVEVWPQEVLQEGPVPWLWCGSKERWLCIALHRHVSYREGSNAEEVAYTACWLGGDPDKDGVEVYWLAGGAQKGCREEKARSKSETLFTTCHLRHPVSWRPRRHPLSRKPGCHPHSRRPRHPLLFQKPRHPLVLQRPKHLLRWFLPVHVELQLQCHQVEIRLMWALTVTQEREQLSVKEVNRRVEE